MRNIMKEFANALHAVNPNRVKASISPDTYDSTKLQYKLCCGAVADMLNKAAPCECNRPGCTEAFKKQFLEWCEMGVRIEEPKPQVTALRFNSFGEMFEALLTGKWPHDEL